MNKSKYCLTLLWTLTLLLLTAFDQCFASCPTGPRNDLCNELLLCESINRKLNDRFPVFYNHLLYGGYINMPSARMGEEGEVGYGFTYAPPYNLYNLRIQFARLFEFSANYRVFVGEHDCHLSKHGFGFKSDKGANLKFALVTPEDSSYRLPGIAFGFDDFVGTKTFNSIYLVGTQVFPKLNLEFSLGYGKRRMCGWFWGMQFLPFRHTRFPSLRLLENLCFNVEYDPIDYTNPEIEPHPKGHEKKSDINLGLKYRVGDLFDMSVSRIRGSEVAFTVSSSYNFGKTKGFVPKINQPDLYYGPAVVEPLGPERSAQEMIACMEKTFRVQGFSILKAYLGYNECSEKTLRLRVLNCRYRYDIDVRDRLAFLLSNLVPIDIDKVIVVIDGDGFPIQEYHFWMDFVRYYTCYQMGKYELAILTPMKEVSDPLPTDLQLFFKSRKPLNLFLMPKNNFLFGSASGKFKYSFGAQLVANGFLWGNLYYSLKLGWVPISNFKSVGDHDQLNPSQLVNVRTDVINYYKQKGITLDEAYVQMTWNLKRGMYTRASLGYYDQAYAGIAGEFLYYPVNSSWAWGAEAAIFQKRKYEGIGFTDTFRRFTKSGCPVYLKHFVPSQLFLSYYYDWDDHGIDLKIKGGKFMADDWGVRWDLSRYYTSGLRITIWYTRTNGRDHINGTTYHDKGIGFSIPLDIFYTTCSRERWGTSMAAWLRDVGYSNFTGSPLYWTIRDQRHCLVE